MSSRSRRAAFSLIELVIVLILMALVASMATISLRGVTVRQRLAKAAERVEQFDLAMRRAARLNRDNAIGIIDRASGQLSIPQANKTFQLPSQVLIAAVRIGKGSDREVTVLPNGSSPSYAVRLSSGDASRWVLFVGGSGQVIHDADASLIEAVLGNVSRVGVYTNQPAVGEVKTGHV